MKIGQPGVLTGYEDRPEGAVDILERGGPSVVLEVPDDDTLRICYLTHDGALIRDLTELVFRSEFLALNNRPLITAAYETA